MSLFLRFNLLRIEDDPKNILLAKWGEAYIVVGLIKNKNLFEKEKKDPTMPYEGFVNSY
jgi:hypothetical protein